MHQKTMKSTRAPRRAALRRVIALALLGLAGSGAAQENRNLLRGEVVFAVNCGRCHINATGRFATPPEEMRWLFWRTGPIKAHHEIISEQDLEAVLDYLEDRGSRTR
jgi:mono/diheme cytochrome c family protein